MEQGRIEVGPAKAGTVPEPRGPVYGALVEPWRPMSYDHQELERAVATYHRAIARESNP